MIDTLQLSKDLGKSFGPEQAEALARAFGQQGDRLVTKLDLEVELTKFRADIDARFSDLAGRFSDVDRQFANVDGRFSSVDVQFAQVRGEIKDLRADLIRWIVGALLINSFGVVGLMITLIKTIH